MTTTSDNSPRRLLQFNKFHGIGVGLGLIVVAVYVWALLNNVSNIITTLGLASLLILLLLPFVTAFMVIRTTSHELKNATVARPFKDYLSLSLRRQVVLITLASVGLIPVLVLFNLYISLYVNALFNSISTCFEPPCTIPTLTLPSNLNQETLQGVIIVLGFWGMTLLACVVGTSLALRGSSKGNVVVGTFFIIVLIDAVLWLVILENAPVFLIAIAAILPYALAFVGVLLQHQTLGQPIATSHV